ncbi:cobalt-precorrin-6A reductase [Tabrizicola oligotrophica]|uniref:Cobalt-precorrin-6A reductase n=1 Tax=Tabrizicola oligotrophica TaxID=2710650 RepID=A0A6M0QYJ0_9RHOB|nr:cobalt-precorrin-6A reductase [Tabrizicola oligotrophica]NEY91532.1 cobalt-precorrin-6A reductase [Tabrizicola oligotrophica]
MTRILVLGGTTEASRLAHALADAGLEAVFSYAGRTEAPIAQPLPMRIGGFGGAAGLEAYLAREGISHVVDATHPFAAQMSRNAIAACAATGTPLVTLERPAWLAGPGDDWQGVADVEAAVAALPDIPARVFLAIGKQTLAPFAAKPQHHYLLRLVDPPEAPLPLPQASVVIARGPFDAEADTALLRAHAITHVVAKNAGGVGAEAKLIAARALHLPVILIDRPALPTRRVVATVAEVMDWLSHPATAGVKTDLGV